MTKRRSFLKKTPLITISFTLADMLPAATFSNVEGKCYYHSTTGDTDWDEACDVLGTPGNMTDRDEACGVIDPALGTPTRDQNCSATNFAGQRDIDEACGKGTYKSPKGADVAYDDIDQNCGNTAGGSLTDEDQRGGDPPKKPASPPNADQ